MGQEAEFHSETNGSSKRKIDEIERAKLKAQEIAARLVNDAESKRPRIDAYSSEPVLYSNSPSHPPVPDNAQKFSSQPITNSQVGSVHFATQKGQHHALQGTSKKINIPTSKVGMIIGRGGETIKYLQFQSGANIQITKDFEADPSSLTRDVELMGTAEQISRAEELINEVIAEIDAGSSAPSANLGFNTMQPGTEQFVMKVPNNKVALLIGKGGETIKSLQSSSGARMQIIPLHLPPGDTSTERIVYINGSKEQIESAKELINELIRVNHLRNPSGPSSYVQPVYPPPGNWGPPGQPSVQQPGYGYTLPGTYPTPPQNYGNYPTTQQADWDQSNPSVMPPPQQSTGYNYYGTQNQTESTTQQGFSQHPTSYGQNISSQAPPLDQQNPYVTPGYGPTTPSSQPDGTTPTPSDWDQSNPSAMPPPQPTGYNYYGIQNQTESSPPNLSYSNSQMPPVNSHSYGQGFFQQPTSYGQNISSQAPPLDQQNPYATPGYGPTTPSSQPDGSTPTPSAQSFPAYPLAYSQTMAFPQAGYGTSLSYTGPPPAQPGYDQTGSTQTGYGGQQPVHAPPIASESIYAQSGYPPQPALPAPANYVQGTNPPVYGQTHL